MKNITQRAVRIYAVLEDFRGGSDDILSAIMPFFEPLLAERNGKGLDAHEFASAVRAAYSWNFTADVVEELIPRFEKHGWLKPISKDKSSASYSVSYGNDAALPARTNELEIGQRLSSVVVEFVKFIDSISPLTRPAKSTEEWCDTLVEWLVSIDAYNEDVLRQQHVFPEKVERTAGLSVVQPEIGRVSTDERYLCARFAKHLFDSNSPFLADLCKIASVGLLTEVVQDFQKPLSKVTKSDLTVYLDAPVALDLLGVSGGAAAENARLVVLQLQAIGVSVRIFDLSVDELVGALNAVMARNPPERTGPTAEALRRHQTTEAFVRSVTIDPEKYLAFYNVNVTKRTIDQFPNQEQYFTRKQYDALYNDIWWQRENRPRTHDAAVIAFVMRMRSGVNRPDIFGSRFIMVTKNGILTQLSRHFCVESGALPKRACPPVIHQRQLATALWLRTGFSNGQSHEIPKRFLLAACERVLELKKAVVEQVRIVGRTMTPEKAEQLDLLLTQDRSAQILMDRTLGVSHVISTTNIEELVDSMRQGLAEEIQNEANARIQAAQKHATVEVRRAGEALRRAEQETKQFQDAFGRIANEDREALEALFRDVNGKIRRRLRLIKCGAGLVIALAGLLPALVEGLQDYFKWTAILVSGLIGASFAYFQVFDRKIGLESHAKGWGAKALEGMAASRGLTRKLAAASWSWDGSELALADTTSDTLL